MEADVGVLRASLHTTLKTGRAALPFLLEWEFWIPLRHSMVQVLDSIVAFVPNACNVQHLTKTASETSEEAANRIELLTNVFHQGLSRATSHCFLGRMFQQNRKSTAARLVGVPVHDASVDGFLVLDNLSHTRNAMGLRRANKAVQQNTSGRRVIAAHHLN